MANSTIWSSCSQLVAISHSQTISSWATLLTEASIQLSPSLCSWHWRCVTHNSSILHEATTNQGGSHKSMDSTMNVLRSMVQRQFGLCLRHCLIIFLLLLSLTTSSSVCMEDCLLKCKLLIRSRSYLESRRFLRVEQALICSGVTQRKQRGGTTVHAELVLSLGL